MKRIRNFVPRGILLTIYNSLIQPHFDYCSVVWGCCSKGLSQKLLSRDLNWSKLNRQLAISKAIMMYNAVNNQTPDYLSTRFTPRHEVLSCSVQNEECKLSIPQPPTNYGKRSFSYRGAVLWNSLPKEIKQSNSRSDFKLKLKNHNFQSDLI